MPRNEMRGGHAPGAAVSDYYELEREMALDEAQRAIRRGAIITWFLAGLYAVLIGLAFIPSTSPLATPPKPWAFVDVGLIALLGFGILRKSRAAAVLMLVYFLSTRISYHVIGRTFAGILLTLLFSFWLYKAVRGTFAYHRLRLAETASTPPVE